MIQKAMPSGKETLFSSGVGWFLRWKLMRMATETKAR
jgi:hypothetical protein